MVGRIYCVSVILNIQTRALTRYSYDALKKCIYQLEKQQHAHDHHYPDLESNEQSTLLGQTDGSETDALFIPLLDRELKKIVLFYEQQKNELMEDFNDLEKDVEFQETLGLQGGAHYADYDDGDEDDDESISSPTESRRCPTLVE